MKRLIIFAALVVVSSAVSAEWTPAGKTEKVNFYVDLATIVKNGNKVKMWSLQDLNQGLMWGNQLVLSSKDFQQYDCQEQTRTLLMTLLHSEHMGKGEIVTSLDIKPAEQKAVPVVPGGGGDTLWKVACGKK